MSSVDSGEVRKSRRRTSKWNWSDVGIVESLIEVAKKVSERSKRGDNSAVGVVISRRREERGTLKDCVKWHAAVLDQNCRRPISQLLIYVSSQGRFSRPRIKFIDDIEASILKVGLIVESYPHRLRTSFLKLFT